MRIWILAWPLVLSLVLVQLNPSPSYAQEIPEDARDLEEVIWALPYETSPPPPKTDFVLNQPFFANMEWILAGQTRLSYERVLLKIERYIRTKRTGWKKRKKEWKLNFDDGRSLFSIHKYSYPVVQTRDGLVLLDGHHHAVTALFFGAKSFPVKIVADLRHLSMKEFLGVRLKAGGGMGVSPRSER